MTFGAGTGGVRAASTPEVVGVDEAVLEPSVFGAMPPSDITEEMLEINAFDLLRSLERQASQLQAEAEEDSAVLAQTKASGSGSSSSSGSGSGSNASSVRSTASMSVSVPNLCVSTSEPEREPTPAAFLESFASVARRQFNIFIHSLS